MGVAPPTAQEEHVCALDKIPVTLIDGRETTFGEWSGQVRLVVNVASRCGLTPQYGQLEELQHRYGDRGFTVLGFPSNQDRKSTRLNSSHVSISYAVFCLK